MWKRALLAGLLLTAPVLVFGDAVSPPTAKTGAPGDGTCAECHAGAVENQGSVVVVSQNFTYTPGVRQSISAQVFSSRAGTMGVELTARLASNPLMQAGHFNESPSYVVRVDSNNGIEYASGGGTSTFDWTPPATDSGDITFYVAAVTGEPDGRPDGNVYTGKFTLSAANTRDLRAGYRYTRFDVPGALDIQPGGISNDGQVVGKFFDGTGSHAFWRQADGAVVTFDARPGAVETTPTGVNNEGRIVGSVIDTVGGYSSGFIREPDGTVTLIDVPDAVSTVLNGINDAGIIVGNFRDGERTNHPMRITSPKAFDFFEVGSLTTATSIASNGVIAGSTYAGRRSIWNTFGGFLLKPDGDVGVALPCSPAIVGEGVNDIHSNALQELVGNCILDVPRARPFGRFMIAANGRTMKESLLAQTLFAGINDAGQIITTQDRQGVIMTPCAVSPVSTTVSAPVDGGVISVHLNNPAPDCKPLAFSNLEWISVFDAGSEYSSQSLSIAANVGDTARVGTVYVAGRDVTITQAGGSCEATLTSSSPPFVSGAMFPGSGGSAMLTITVASGCAWSASVNVPWIKFEGGFSGTSTGTIGYTVEANPIRAARMGVILVSSRAFAIIQAAGT